MIVGNKGHGRAICRDKQNASIEALPTATPRRGRLRTSACCRIDEHHFGSIGKTNGNPGKRILKHSAWSVACVDRGAALAKMPDPDSGGTIAVIPIRP